MFRSRPSSFVVSTALAVCVGVLGAGCDRRSDAERRASERATANAEEIAQETTITSAAFDADGGSAEERSQGAAAGDADAQRARGEMVAAFRLEQSDYRARLEGALNQLDKAVARAKPNGARHGTAGEARTRELRERRARLKADLEAVDRSTEQDWATLRTRIERDLE